MDYNKEDATSEIENRLNDTNCDPRGPSGRHFYTSVIKTMLIGCRTVPRFLPVTQQRSLQFIKAVWVCIYNFSNGYLHVHCWQRTLSLKPDSRVKGANCGLFFTYSDKLTCNRNILWLILNCVIFE